MNIAVVRWIIPGTTSRGHGVEHHLPQQSGTHKPYRLTDDSYCQALSAVGGGVLYCDTDTLGKVAFHQSTFAHNTASAGPGGVAVLYGSVVGFYDCVMEHNEASQVGGALALWNFKGNVSKCSFLGNTVAAEELGSSLYVSQGSQFVITR